MNIECAQCGSTEFSKLPLIYAEGFSRLEAYSRGWGLLFGSGGTDLAFGRLKTKGEIQTRLSQRVSPPHKWSYWKILFWGLIGLFILEFILGYLDTFLHYGGNFNQQLSWFGYIYAALSRSRSASPSGITTALFRSAIMPGIARLCAGVADTYSKWRNRTIPGFTPSSGELASEVALVHE